MNDGNLTPTGDGGSREVPKEKENQTPNHSDSKPQCAETPSALIPAKSNEPPAPRHQCRKRYKSIKEEIKYWFEVFAIIGGLFGLVLIWLQYKDMTRATDASVKQSKALVAQSEIMQGQLDEMKKSRQDDERAWVMISDFKQQVPNNRDFAVIQLIYKNTGRTPALDVQTVNAWVQGTNSILQTDPKPNPPVNGGSCAPDATGTTSTTPIPASIMQDIGKGPPFYLLGTIWYNDIFRKQHWTQFCFRIIPDSVNPAVLNFSAATFHNSCDYTETNQSN